MQASNAQSVNIRSFHPDSMQGNEFIYGITDVETAVCHVERLASKGLYTIVNETIDVNDGGVSGVVQNNFIEFSPGVTPRVWKTRQTQYAGLTLNLVSVSCSGPMVRT